MLFKYQNVEMFRSSVFFGLEYESLFCDTSDFFFPTNVSACLLSYLGFI